MILDKARLVWINGLDPSVIDTEERINNNIYIYIYIYMQIYHK